MNADIALGTKVFTRTAKLEKLLNTAPDWITTAYIADDGKMTPEKETLYRRNYQFNLNVINLEYDSGVGAGRNAIVNAVEEDYIFIVDPDHRIPPSARILYDQLQNRLKLGGISGLLIEPRNNRLYSQAADFNEVMTEDGMKLVRETYSTNQNKHIEMEEYAPVVNFDFIPQATLFRTDCLDEQSWDSEFITEFEHTDFYLSHWQNTDWNFAINPSVQIPHYPGGDTDYMTSRKDPQKRSSGREYFLQKWDYIKLETTEGRWIEAGSIGGVAGNMTGAIDILRDEGIIALLKQGRLFVKNNL